MLAHRVVRAHNEHTILSAWPLIAALANVEICAHGYARRRALIERLHALVGLCAALKTRVWLEKSIEEDFE